MRGFLLLAALGMAASPSLADLGLRKVNRMYRLKMNLRTGDVKRVQDASALRGPGTTVWDVSFDTPWFFPEDAGFGGPTVVLDWGDIADTDPNATTVGQMVIGYATNSNSPNRPILDLGFWGGDDGFDSFATRFPIAVFRLTLFNIQDFPNVNIDPNNQGIGIIVGINLPPNAPMVMTGPDLGDANPGPVLGPNTLGPNCNAFVAAGFPVDDPNCSARFAAFIRTNCADRTGLRDFGYSYDFRNTNQPFPPVGEITGPLLQIPDPNLIRAGACPAPGVVDAFDAYSACTDPNACTVPGPNDVLVPDVTALYAGSFFFGSQPFSQWPLTLITPAGAACPEDLNGDGQRDLTDLSILLQNFGGAGGPADGDINGDGNVDLTDLSLLLQAFGSPCP